MTSRHLMVLAAGMLLTGAARAELDFPTRPAPGTIALAMTISAATAVAARCEGQQKAGAEQMLEALQARAAEMAPEQRGYVSGYTMANFLADLMNGASREQRRAGCREALARLGHAQTSGMRRE
ncbi:hypothetical protein EOD42_02930 [Rhodovarius crocodyli]|uniref:UrcA family protein n=1 Tax=Rhodovarius crocodyli TaxID=1979269 RepID=A0A437MN65_9PROT|nr:hypothetical protein [Rhodovarius crocodyli]RVT99077.1 hypothetical protein EOD42_02930 [Rhodovarius crocodyli]